MFTISGYFSIRCKNQFVDENDTNMVFESICPQDPPLLSVTPMSTLERIHMVLEEDDSWMREALIPAA
jgi:hypothetical protein